MAIVNVDTTVAYSDGSVAQADWLGPNLVSICAVLFTTHQISRVNIHNSCAMMTRCAYYYYYIIYLFPVFCV